LKKRDRCDRRGKEKRKKKRRYMQGIGEFIIR